jgi:hypothetical protein
MRQEIRDRVIELARDSGLVVFDSKGYPDDFQLEQLLKIVDAVSCQPCRELKVIGTTGCDHCEEGRVTMYSQGDKCLECKRR